MTVPLIRKRARRPKVRTGCRTCRTRHVKCGEEKPTCFNCDRTGRDCAGYDLNKLPDRSQRRMLQAKDAYLMPRLHCAVSTLPNAMQSTTGFEYFLCKAFRELPGDSWALAWDRLILPFCHAEPAILYGAMAIGSLQQHLSTCIGGDPTMKPIRPTTALAQYGRSAAVVRASIQEYLQKSSSANGIESILTASLLLFCFEILHDEDELANMHLANGLKVLHEYLARTRATTAVQEAYHERPVELSVAASSRMDLLIHTFVRLDADMSPLISDTTFLSPICKQPVPTSFTSLEEAMTFIDVVQSRVFNIGHELDVLAETFLEATYPNFNSLDETVQEMLVLATSRTVEAPTDLLLLIEGAKQNVQALMAALATIPARDPPDPRRLLVELHLFIVWFDASVWRDGNEMEVDRFDQSFDHIMGIAEQYYAANKAETMQSTQDAASQTTGLTTRAAFAIGSSIVNTVCTIIEKSRNSTIRRRGIKLIAATDMRGVFDGAFLASYYQSVVDMEEDEARRLLGQPSTHLFHFNEIPAEARLMEVEITEANNGTDDGCEVIFYHRRVGRMVYAYYSDGALQHGERLFNVRRPFAAD